MMVVIGVVALASATMVMTKRSQRHLRRASFYDQQKQEAIRRIDLDVAGVAHCREGLARIRKYSGGDAGLKAWMDWLPSRRRASASGSLMAEALKIWSDRLTFWEAEADKDRK